MNTLKKPKFQRTEIARVFEKMSLPELAWRLGIEQTEIRKWNILMPALESQYLRESSASSTSNNRKVTRRRMQKEPAIALFGGIRKLEKWLGERVDYPGEWLSEYHTLLVEYATKGVLKGVSIKAIEKDKAV